MASTRLASRAHQPRRRWEVTAKDLRTKMRPAASVRKATAALPLRLGAPAEFRRVADLLLRSAFDEPTVCKALGIDSLANLGTVHRGGRSEEHTSELQSRVDLVCRLL